MGLAIGHQRGRKRPIVEGSMKRIVVSGVEYQRLHACRACILVVAHGFAMVDNLQIC